MTLGDLEDVIRASGYQDKISHCAEGTAVWNGRDNFWFSVDPKSDGFNKMFANTGYVSLAVVSNAAEANEALRAWGCVA